MSVLHPNVGLAITAALLVATPMATSQGAAPAAAALQRDVPRALSAWGVPGAAVAIVKDGRIVTVRGFGVREAGKPGAVGEHTLFALASLTKGFTAAAAGTLVDAGRLTWDEPLATLLPGFAVADAYVAREMTLTDALAHRSGLSEGIDAAASFFGADRAEVLRRLARTPQAGRFREGFTYLNTLYVAAGEGLARRADTPYEELVRTRLLEPLALRDARFGAAAVRAAADRATPHVDTDGTARAVEPDDADVETPAAGLYASASDIARWLLAQLGDGMLDGRRAWSAAVAQAMRTPHAIVPFEHIPKALFPSTHFLAYGLGWMLQDYRGEFVVWNTGGLRGMTCSIAYLPGRKFGVAVLTNGPRTSLPEALVWDAIDAELGGPTRDWSAERLKRSLAGRAAARAADAARDAVRSSGTPPALPLARYAGTYEQPALGTVAIRETPAGLALRLGRGLEATLAPQAGESFVITWDKADYGRSEAHFTLEGGQVTALDIDELGHFTRTAP